MNAPVADTVQIVCDHPADELRLKDLKTLAAEVLRAEGGDFSVTVILADDNFVRRLNLLYLRRTGTTDVIAFPPQAEEESPGEVVVNLEQAREQAAEAGETLHKATARLVVHGILHLTGWNDQTDEERREMLRRGEQYLTDIV